MQTLRNKKVFFIDTLSADASFVLQHAEQYKIITKREYNNLKHPNHTQEKIIINLLDNVMNKGNETCRKFLQLLECEELQDSFPNLKEHFTPAPPALNQDSPEKPLNEITEYKMSSMPRGLCVIINNIKFRSSHWYREGSEVDEEYLEKVFNWLRFTVEVHRDQSAQQIKDLLRQLSQKNHKGDCFVCCILSHGGSKGVYGTDENVVSSEDIFSPFRGTSCPSLANKPKVFFIQACRGKEYQPRVEVQADSLGAERAEEELETELEEDTIQMVSIPNDGDFLVARSTVKGFYSIRNKRAGSWFIQSLCKQLETYCPKCEDIQSILICVNREVSEKVSESNPEAKQMPVQKVTLRKKLVFHVPN